VLQWFFTASGHDFSRYKSGKTALPFQQGRMTDTSQK
jgi:hypothetical protein